MSTLRVSTIQDTAGSNSSTPAAIANGIAKAWVNFNGTGTVAIRAQYNVSSITDNGNGDYTVNFTNALADANYFFAGMGQYDTTGGGDRRVGVARVSNAIAAGSARIQSLDGGGTPSDFLVVAFAVFR